MRLRSDFEHVKWRVSMKYLLSFQFCLNVGNLCIYRDVSNTFNVAVAAVCFCLTEIRCFATILSEGDYANKCNFKLICCSIDSNNLQNFRFC